MNMISLFLILFPMAAGMLHFFLKDGKTARSFALFSSLATLIIALLGLTVYSQPEQHSFSRPWLTILGSSFSLQADGMGKVLTLLNAVAYPLVILGTWQRVYAQPGRFFGLMLLAQAGMMGVFLATDALLFYFFWELALIPMYFLASQWGGERRIPVTFKFFIYTFAGSVLMLAGLLYLQTQTADHSFSMAAFHKLKLHSATQLKLFWLFFVAFAIKMPVFPFHTWQPDTYEQAPAATTMILSGVMVKMGLLGLARWLMPVLPVASYQWGDVVMSLSVIGIIYASLIAIRQDDLKRLVAYSSIAHIGLMSAALFAENLSATQGVMIQMFNHGINIIGLWILIDIIERRYGTRKISELGGIARQAPVLAVFFVVIALANIALPLTNAFPGEFLMFNGILGAKSKYYILFVILAGLGIILAAVYTLNMIRRCFYGEPGTLSAAGGDLQAHEKWVLGIIVGLILWMGIYPQSLLGLSEGFSLQWLERIDISYLFRK